VWLYFVEIKRFLGFYDGNEKKSIVRYVLWLRVIERHRGDFVDN